MKASGASVDPSLVANLRATSHSVDWTLDTPQHESSSAWYWLWKTPKMRYEDARSLNRFRDSPAAVSHNFVYTGKGGYFYSPYLMSDRDRIIKLFFQWAEGSLLDFQLGDIIPSCTAGKVYGFPNWCLYQMTPSSLTHSLSHTHSHTLTLTHSLSHTHSRFRSQSYSYFYSKGDIRVSYSVKDPKRVSGVGGIQTGSRGSLFGERPITLTSHVTKNTNRSVGLLHEGFLSTDEMIAVEAWASKQFTLFARAIFFLWSLYIAHLVSVFWAVPHQLWSTRHILRALAITGISISLCWIYAVRSYGAEQGLATYDQLSTILIAVSTVALTWDVLQLSKFFTAANVGPMKPHEPHDHYSQQHNGWSGRGGFNAVWCHIMRMCDAPPDWRQEITYDTDDSPENSPQ